MEQKLSGFIIIFIAVLLMVSAQLLFKNRLTLYGEMSMIPVELWKYLVKLIYDWKIWVAAIFTLTSALLWYIAVSRVPLSIAFPTAAMSYPMILIGSAMFLNEDITVTKIIGNVLIVTGVLTVSMFRSVS